MGAEKDLPEAERAWIIDRKERRATRGSEPIFLAGENRRAFEPSSRALLSADFDIPFLEACAHGPLEPPHG